MKKYFLLIFITSSITLSGQSNIYFNKLIFPYNSTNHLLSIENYNDNFLVLSGWLDSGYFYNQSYSLVVLNLQGDILDKRLYLDTTHWYYFYPGNSLVIATDSTIIMAGCRWNLQKGSHAFLMRVDTNLDTLFTKEFTHPDTIAAAQPGAYTHNQFTSIRETYDKGFILTGKYNYQCNTNGIEKPYLLKLDSLCNVEWIRKYNDDALIYEVELAPDSGYYFVFLSTVNNIMRMIKADQSGNIEWFIVINSLPYSSGPANLEIYDDNTLYIGSSYWYDPVLGKRGIVLTKVDIPSQQRVWERNYVMFNNFSHSTLHQTIGLDITHDGNLIISGTVEMPDPQNPGVLGFKGFIAKIDPNGDSLWARYFGYGDFQYINQVNDIVLTDDGGFLTVGYFRDWHPGIMYQDAWLVKMDSLGCDTPGCHLVGIGDLPAQRHGAMVLYPNPFSNELNISLPEGPAGATAILYDMQGRMIRQIRIPENLYASHYTMQTNDLAPGIYILHLITKEGLKHVGRIVRSR